MVPRNTAAKKAPKEVDVQVGQRIRARRIQCKRSQEWLAGKIGVTFQQVQKYEKGTNRVGASRLEQIATALGVPPAYFFQGLGRESETEAGRATAAFLATREGAEIAEKFGRLAPYAQRAVTRFVTTLAEATP